MRPPTARAGMTAAVVLAVGVIVAVAVTQRGDAPRHVETGPGTTASTGNSLESGTSTVSVSTSTTRTTVKLAASTTRAAAATSTTLAPQTCKATDLTVALHVSPTDAGPGESIHLHLVATNSSGQTCLVRERTSWPKWDLDVRGIDRNDSNWGYAICQGGKEGNPHLATADADVAWAPGEARTIDRAWDQMTCANTQAASGRYLARGYWTAAAEQPVAFSPDVALTLHS